MRQRGQTWNSPANWAKRGKPSIIDFTVTAAGARCSQPAGQPLNGVAAIEARLDEVSHFETMPELGQFAAVFNRCRTLNAPWDA
jgi:hypothetical protein